MRRMDYWEVLPREARWTEMVRIFLFLLSRDITQFQFFNVHVIIFINLAI
jgi:hypothetical protein